MFQTTNQMINIPEIKSTNLGLVNEVTHSSTCDLPSKATRSMEIHGWNPGNDLKMVDFSIFFHGDFTEGFSCCVWTGA